MRFLNIKDLYFVEVILRVEEVESNTCIFHLSSALFPGIQST